MLSVGLWPNLFDKENIFTACKKLIQTKFAKVMFSQVSVCPQGRGGMHGRGGVVGGHAWEGRAWQVGMHGRGVHGRGACVAGGGGACMAGEMATAVESTYPTGMHSCELWNFNRNQCRLSLTLRGAVYKYNFSLR